MENYKLDQYGVEIQLVKYGLGNRIGNTIELNRNLLKYPDLFDKVLKHEIKHVKGKAKVDLEEPFDKKLLGFIISYPSTWVHFLPLWFRKNKIIYNKTMALLWIFLICYISIIVWYIRWLF